MKGSDFVASRLSVLLTLTLKRTYLIFRFLRSPEYRRELEARGAVQRRDNPDYTAKACSERYEKGKSKPPGWPGSNAPGATAFNVGPKDVAASVSLAGRVTTGGDTSPLQRLSFNGAPFIRT